MKSVTFSLCRKLGSHQDELAKIRKFNKLPLKSKSLKERYYGFCYDINFILGGNVFGLESCDFLLLLLKNSKSSSESKRSLKGEILRSLLLLYTKNIICLG